MMKQAMIRNVRLMFALVLVLSYEVLCWVWTQDRQGCWQKNFQGGGAIGIKPVLTTKNGRIFEICKREYVKSWGAMPPLLSLADAHKVITLTWYIIDNAHKDRVESYYFNMIYHWWNYYVTNKRFGHGAASGIELHSFRFGTCTKRFLTALVWYCKYSYFMA